MRISTVPSDLAHLRDVHSHVAPPPHDRFEAMIRRHHVRLRRFAAAMLLDRAHADDVLQEAYLKAYRRPPKPFANLAHESAWLHRVVYRCCVDELRRAARRAETPTAAVGEIEDPWTVVARTELAEAWLRISDADRTVLLLVDVAGFEYAEAARLLRVRPGTLGWRLSTARDRLRKELE
jgi:RNA polymerase sigma-70 factor, ECF subfamily